MASWACISVTILSLRNVTFLCICAILCNFVHLCNFVLLSAILSNCVQYFVKLCADLCYFVQLCAILYNFAQNCASCATCTSLFNFVQLCSTLRNFVQLCATWYISVQKCEKNVHWFSLCTNFVVALPGSQRRLPRSSWAWPCDRTCRRSTGCSRCSSRVPLHKAGNPKLSCIHRK